MYILNTTFTVEPSAHDRWFDILKNGYIPLLRQRGFSELTFTRVLSEEPSAHHTYSLQVGVPDMTRYRELTGDLFGEYLRIADPLFGAQVCRFTTLMKKLDV